MNNLLTSTKNNQVNQIFEKVSHESMIIIISLMIKYIFLSRIKRILIVINQALFGKDKNKD